MSSRSNPFECQWQASSWLLAGYLGLQAVVVCCLLLLHIPLWGKTALGLFCCLHALWVLPRHVLLTADSAFTGLRCSAEGWAVYSRANGWQAIALHPDSLALPLIVLVRFRLGGKRRTESLCVPRDSLPRDTHRRLRVRLKFSRHRWEAAK